MRKYCEANIKHHSTQVEELTVRFLLFYNFFNLHVRNHHLIEN